MRKLGQFVFAGGGSVRALTLACVMAGTCGEPASAQLQADVQVAWTHDYTTVPYGETCSPDGSTIGGGYCTIHIHLPGSYPIASITSLVATAADCASHGDGTVTFGGPFASGPCPPGCSQSPDTNHWNILWPISSRHNMPHTIHVEGTCSSYPPFGTSYTFEGDATFTLSNLIVKPTQPVNPEPILWHGDPEEPVTLRAEVSSAYKAQQAVKLRIYNSDQALVKTFETTSTIGPGASELEFEWNGSQDPPREGVAPKGIYLFRWEIGGAGPTMDYDQDKSALMLITQTSSALTDFYDEETDMNHMNDSCVVVDYGSPLRNPSAGFVKVYDGDLNALTAPTNLSLVSNPPGTPEPVWSDATVAMVVAQTEYHLFSVCDDHAGSDRAHRSRWCLQMNSKKPRPLADNYCMIPSAGRVDNSARSWQKRLWDVRSSYRGAYRARANGAALAGYVMGALPTDRIMHYWGHGSGGGGGVVTASQMIWAQRAYPEEPGSFLTDLCLPNLRLVVWQACETALTDQVRGNLAQQAVTQGATCSVGFRAPVMFEDRLASCARQWAYFFWLALAQGPDQKGEPATVRDALGYAVEKVKDYNRGDPMGYDTAQIFGNGNIRVVPAN